MLEVFCKGGKRGIFCFFPFECRIFSTWLYPKMKGFNLVPTTGMTTGWHFYFVKSYPMRNNKPTKSDFHFSHSFLQFKKKVWNKRLWCAYLFTSFYVLQGLIERPKGTKYWDVSIFETWIFENSRSNLSLLFGTAWRKNVFGWCFEAGQLLLR